MKIVKLELKTHLLTEMKEFYVNRLGFILKHQTIDSFTILAGETELTFIREDDGNEPYYHFALNIPQNKIYEAKSWLLQKNCQLVHAESLEHLNFYVDDNVVFLKGVNAHSVYFYDPSGNNVEFIARHNLENSSTEPFDISSIINVSEIGMAVENCVPEVTETLCSQSNVSPFAGDGKVFQMVGDDHGLYILGDIALTSLSWYPTQRSPEIHLIRMTVLSKQNNQFQLKSYPYFIRTITST